MYCYSQRVCGSSLLFWAKCAAKKPIKTKRRIRKPAPNVPASIRLESTVLTTPTRLRSPIQPRQFLEEVGPTICADTS